MQSYDLCEDRELFARIAQGEEAAFTAIYLRYAELLMPYVTRMLDSQIWAEEIVQDVLTTLWEKRATLDKIDNPKAWIYRTASNRTIDFLRRRTAEIKVQYWLARNSEDETGNPVEKEFDFRASDNLYKEAVSELSGQKQRIFRMRHEEGYSYEEIATELNISKNTVRNNLNEALHFIRRYLLQHGILHALWFTYYFTDHIQN